jgi:predicted transposase/invertase (TIGR01784 family)
VSIETPHDSIFKAVESNKTNAIDLLQGILPLDIKSKIDFKTLTLDTSEYINTELRKCYSDLVYSCIYEASNPIKIATLFEHKSTPIDFPYLQINKYILAIYENNVKQTKELIPVITILFYHGKEAWNPGIIYDYFKDLDQSLREFIPAFRIIFVDMNSYSDDDIIYTFNQIANQILFLIMKNIYNVIKLKKKLKKYLKLGKFYYESDEGEKFLVSIIHYLFNTSDFDDDFIDTIKEISKKGGKAAMTLATKIEERGKLKGKIEDAKKMLEKKYNVEDIMEITGLSREYIEKLITSDQEEIR